MSEDKNVGGPVDLASLSPATGSALTLEALRLEIAAEVAAWTEIENRLGRSGNPMAACKAAGKKHAYAHCLELIDDVLLPNR